MARQTVSEIFAHIGSTVNQDPSVPTDGSADFLLWMSFLNRAQIEWAESYDWEELRKVYYPSITGFSQATIALPLDFRKLSAPILNYSVGIQDGQPWEEVPADRLQWKNTVSDRFFIVTGDSNGHYMNWYPATIASGASIAIPYYSMPTSLASVTQYTVTPDGEYLAQRVIAYVLETRSDPRYQDEEQKARERLLQMVENANLIKFSSYVNPVRIMTQENRKSFRLGRN